MADAGAMQGPAPRTRGPIFIIGPTAVGKSAVALALAEKIGGEIVSVDSMQVYRGLDIGTAKPSDAERARILHHLIDVVDLTQAFDAAQFCRLAAAAVTSIQSRGNVPVFCGGTGLYFRAYFEGLGEVPRADVGLRTQLEQTPLGDLLRELETKDPETFARIDRRNPRRVIRAIEVIRLTGRPFSAQRAAWGGPSAATATSGLLFALDRSADDLKSRIDSRVDEMFRRGLVEETRHLMTQGLMENKTAMQSIGYRQVVEHLRGERSLADTIQLVKIKTRQFAKRQRTWIRGQLPVRWIQVASDDRGTVDAIWRNLPN